MATNETENINIENENTTVESENTVVENEKIVEEIENNTVNLDKQVDTSSTDSETQETASVDLNKVDENIGESVNLNIKNDGQCTYTYETQEQQQYNNFNQQQYGFNNQNMYNDKQLEYMRTHDKSIPETPEDKAKADKLCKISLLLFFGPQIISAVIFGGFYVLSMLLGFDFDSIDSFGTDSYDIVSKIFGGIYAVFSLLGQAAGIGSFVTMIYVRVKYPKNTFGKVLMWLYIALIATAIIALFVIVAACMTALKDCPG